MKKALIMNITYNYIGMMKALRGMGYYVYAIGMYSGLHGQKYADEYIPLDYSDRNAVLELARKLQIDAVCACCNDTGVITASYVAEKMGLRGHDTYKNALLLEYKDRFSRFLWENGIQSGGTRAFSDVEQAIAALEETEYPIIVKPIDLCGGVGVKKAENKREAVEAVREAFAVTRNSRIVIESFYEGKQYGLCTFLLNQKVVRYCTNNELSVVNPYRVEMDLFPSDCPPSIVQKLIEKIEKISSILKLEDGIFHIQFIVHNGKAHIIEAMRRVPGNLYLKLASKRTGFDWDYWETRTHCGIDCSQEILPDCREERGGECYAYRSIVGDRNGVVEDVHVAPEVEQYIWDRLILYQKGQKLQNHKTEQLALFFFRFPDFETMKRVLVDEYEKIYVEMRD